MRQCLIDFGVVFFIALTESQGWTPTSSKGVVPILLVCRLQSQRFGGRKHKEEMFLMIPADQLMPGTKRPQWELA